MPKTPIDPIQAALEAAVADHERKGTVVYYPPADAYVPEQRAYRLSLVRAGDDGHCPTGTWPYNGGPGEQMPYFVGPDLNAATRLCDKLNQRMGISPEVAALIVARSMARGSPGAPRTSVLERLARALGVTTPELKRSRR